MARGRGETHRGAEKTHLVIKAGAIGDKTNGGQEHGERGKSGGVRRREKEAGSRKGYLVIDPRSIGDKNERARRVET